MTSPEENGSTDHTLKYTLTQSPTATRNAFQQRFPDRNPPSRSTFFRNVEKYSNEGTSLNLNRGNSGITRAACSTKNIDAVRDLLEQNPHVSARRNPIPISRSSLNRIMTLEIKWNGHIEFMCDMSCWLATFNADCVSCGWFNERCRGANF